MNGFVKHQPTTSRIRVRQGFTLVELLVVIVVIAILIALLVPAIGSAFTAAKNGRMAIEVANLTQAVEGYKTEFGAYPPDFAGADTKDIQEINNHLGRLRRYRTAQQDGPGGNGAKFTGLDPAESLVFWLWGYSPDPKLPLAGANGPIANGMFVAPWSQQAQFQSQPNSIFKFEQTRLRDADGDGYPEYYPTDSEQPYVYLQKDNYALAYTSSVQIASGVVVKPYVRETPPNAPNKFVQADSFQIICAGQDGKFGQGGVYPDGLGYGEGDEDNLANFSEGKTLQDAIP